MPIAELSHQFTVPLGEHEAKDSTHESECDERKLII